MVDLEERVHWSQWVPYLGLISAPIAHMAGKPSLVQQEPEKRFAIGAIYHSITLLPLVEIYYQLCINHMMG